MTYSTGIEYRSAIRRHSQWWQEKEIDEVTQEERDHYKEKSSRHHTLQRLDNPDSHLSHELHSSLSEVAVEGRGHSNDEPEWVEANGGSVDLWWIVHPEKTHDETTDSHCM